MNTHTEPDKNHIKPHTNNIKPYTKYIKPHTNHIKLYKNHIKPYTTYIKPYKNNIKPNLGMPLGAGTLPRAGPGASKGQPQTTQTAFLECLWGAFWGWASRGGPGTSRIAPRRPKIGLPPQRRACFWKTPKDEDQSSSLKCARRRGVMPISAARMQPRRPKRGLPPQRHASFEKTPNNYDQ